MKKVIKTILLMIIIMLGFMMSSYAKEEYNSLYELYTSLDLA